MGLEVSWHDRSFNGFQWWKTHLHKYTVGLVSGTFTFIKTSSVMICFDERIIHRDQRVTNSLKKQTNKCLHLRLVKMVICSQRDHLKPIRLSDVLPMLQNALTLHSGRGVVNWFRGSSTPFTRRLLSKHNLIGKKTRGFIAIWQQKTIKTADYPSHM